MAYNLKILAFFAASLPAAATAQSYCLKPQPPYCLSVRNTFADSGAFDSCRREMDWWQSNVAEFSRCLRDYVENVADDARKEQDAAVWEYEEGVDRWNCMAKNPNGYC